MVLIHAKKGYRMSDKKIMVMGDVHGKFSVMNTLINRKQPWMVLACGDFGYWPKIERYRDSYGQIVKPTAPRVGNTQVHWCDGNHEDHHSLKSAPVNGELWPNVFYHRRGSTLTLPDGRVILFMGGAESVDKSFRTPGFDWFPEESITQADLDALPDCHVDIVISHTCPMEFQMQSMFEFNERQSRIALSVVLEKYKPKEWFFGHWHTHVVGEYYDTKWQAVNKLMDTGSWIWL